MCVVPGYLEGKQIRTLLDPGSEMSFVDKDFCKLYNTIHSTSNYFAKTANNEIQQLHKTNKTLRLQIQGYIENVEVAVCSLSHAIVLGVNWNNEHKTKLNLKTNNVILELRRKRFPTIAS